MSGNNPYSNGFGSQMTATAHAASPAAAPAAGGGLVKDTTTAGFTKDVLEESRRQPVLVDFWAPWCGPCKQLHPIIERVVQEAGGSVKLVKLNIDDHPAIPGQMGIQSIPAVVAFVNGRPVDGFMGALPESQVREFIARVGGPAGGADAAAAEAEIAAVLADAAKLLATRDYDGAGELYGAVLQAVPDNLDAAAGIAECMIGLGRLAETRELLASLPEDADKHAGIQAARKKLDQFEEARKLGDPQALEHQLSLDPDDHATRMKLAKIRSAEGNRDEAADHLLLIMRRDRSFEEDGARRQLLEFFDAWGAKDPATLAARRKLSSILFS